MCIRDRAYTEYKKWGLWCSLQEAEWLVLNSDAQYEVIAEVAYEWHRWIGLNIKEHEWLEIERETKKYVKRLDHEKVICTQNSVWWDKNIIIIRTKTELDKRWGRCSNIRLLSVNDEGGVLIYGCEVWTMREVNWKFFSDLTMSCEAWKRWPELFFYSSVQQC